MSGNEAILKAIFDGINWGYTSWKLDRAAFKTLLESQTQLIKKTVGTNTAITLQQKEGLLKELMPAFTAALKEKLKTYQPHTPEYTFLIKAYADAHEVVKAFAADNPRVIITDDPIEHSYISSETGNISESENTENNKIAQEICTLLESATLNNQKLFEFSERFKISLAVTIPKFNLEQKTKFIEFLFTKLEEDFTSKLSVLIDVDEQHKKAQAYAAAYEAIAGFATEVPAVIVSADKILTEEQIKNKSPTEISTILNRIYKKLLPIKQWQTYRYVNVAPTLTQADFLKLLEEQALQVKVNANQPQNFLQQKTELINELLVNLAIEFVDKIPAYYADSQIDSIIENYVLAYTAIQAFSKKEPQVTLQNDLIYSSKQLKKWVTDIQSDEDLKNQMKKALEESHTIKNTGSKPYQTSSASSSPAKKILVNNTNATTVAPEFVNLSEASKVICSFAALTPVKGMMGGVTLPEFVQADFLHALKTQAAQLQGHNSVYTASDQKKALIDQIQTDLEAAFIENVKLFSKDEIYPTLLTQYIQAYAAIKAFAGSIPAALPAIAIHSGETLRTLATDEIEKIKANTPNDAQSASSSASTTTSPATVLASGNSNANKKTDDPNFDLFKGIINGIKDGSLTLDNLEEAFSTFAKTDVYALSDAQKAKDFLTQLCNGDHGLWNTDIQVNTPDLSLLNNFFLVQLYTNFNDKGSATFLSELKKYNTTHGILLQFCANHIKTHEKPAAIKALIGPKDLEVQFATTLFAQNDKDSNVQSLMPVHEIATQQENEEARVTLLTSAFITDPTIIGTLNHEKTLLRLAYEKKNWPLVSRVIAFCNADCILKSDLGDFFHQLVESRQLAILEMAFAKLEKENKSEEIKNVLAIKYGDGEVSLLHIAASQLDANKDDLLIVELLLNKGADPLATNKLGQTANLCVDQESATTGPQIANAITKASLAKQNILVKKQRGDGSGSDILLANNSNEETSSGYCSGILQYVCKSYYKIYNYASQCSSETLLRAGLGFAGTVLLLSGISLLFLWGFSVLPTGGTSISTTWGTFKISSELITAGWSILTAFCFLSSAAPLVYSYRGNFDIKTQSEQSNQPVIANKL